MSRQLAYRASLVAIVGAAALAGATAAAPAGGSADGGDLAPYTAARTGVITNSGVTGRTMIVSAAGSAHSIVRIHAAGLQPRREYGVHVHFGACRDYQGQFQYQSPDPVTRQNEIWLDLIANPAGRAHDQVKVPRLDVTAPTLDRRPRPVQP